MYYDTNSENEVLQLVEANLNSMENNFLKKFNITINFPQKTFIDEEIWKLKMLIYKIEVTKICHGMKRFVARELKNTLELYLLAWLVLYKATHEKHVMRGLTDMPEAEDEKKENKESLNVNEAMKFALQAEERLKETKKLLEYLRGTNLIEF